MTTATWTVRTTTTARRDFARIVEESGCGRGWVELLTWVGSGTAADTNGGPGVAPRLRYGYSRIELMLRPESIYGRTPWTDAITCAVGLK